MSIAGLDIGTTNCKLTVYDDGGRYLGRESRNYPVRRDAAAHVIDAGDIWGAVRDALSAAAARFREEIRGIGVASFGESFALLDKNDEPLLPVMLYTDPRGAEECAELSGRVGADRLAYLTGAKPHQMYSVSKLMWVRGRLPEVYGRAAGFHSVAGYIVYMLTGVRQIDYSLAARTMAFDIRKLAWSGEILSAAQIDAGLLPEPVPTGTPAGKLRPRLARELGLPAGMLVVTVSHDQVASAVGAGIFDPACAADGTGTTECITPLFDGIPDGEVMTGGGYSVIPYVLPGKYVTYAYTITGGALIDWYVSQLAGYAKLEADASGRSVFEALEASVKDEPTGILVLPHFAGAATPYMDAGSKGAVVGLDLTRTMGDLYRAMMEGVTYEMLLNIERLRRAGVAFSSLRATGGGAASALWMQMKADIFGMPVISLGSAEAGAAGGAMFAGIAAGAFADLPQAAAAMLREDRAYYPRAGRHEQYMEIYQRYKRLYPAVRGL